MTLACWVDPSPKSEEHNKSTTLSLLGLEAMNVVEDEAVVVKGDGARSEDAAVPVLTNNEVEVPEEDQVGMMREETRGEDDDLEVVAMTGV